jgi:membrane protein implicated in regulation of membrane protease activity
MNPVDFIWIIAAIIFIIIEAATMGLATIWFAFASIAAWLVQIIGVPPLGQIAVFLIVSAVLLYYTRPIALKYFKVGRVKTNADRLVGETGKVTEEIDNLNAKGLVKISGQIWTSRSLENKVIPVETLVHVESIDGVKLIVTELEDN